VDDVVGHMGRFPGDTPSFVIVTVTVTVTVNQLTLAHEA
jgi:hypothetical protein